MSTEPKHQAMLLSCARQAIRYRLLHSEGYSVDHGGLPEALLQPRASFVTLRIEQQLRGCIGNLEACEALIDSIIHNADSAAFQDPRFTPVSQQQAAQLHIHISLLNQATAMNFDDEECLLSQLRPGIDGLVLRIQQHHATFLPAVWQQLPHPRQFLSHLKRKAGLAEDFWHPELQVERYTVDQFGD